MRRWCSYTAGHERSSPAGGSVPVGSAGAVLVVEVPVVSGRGADPDTSPLISDPINAMTATRTCTHPAMTPTRPRSSCRLTLLRRCESSRHPESLRWSHRSTRRRPPPGAGTPRPRPVAAALPPSRRSPPSSRRAQPRDARRRLDHGMPRSGRLAGVASGGLPALLDGRPTAQHGCDGGHQGHHAEDEGEPDGGPPPGRDIVVEHQHQCSTDGREEAGGGQGRQRPDLVGPRSGPLRRLCPGHRPTSLVTSRRAADPTSPRCRRGRGRGP